MKKKLSLLLIAFLGIVGFMFAATMEATEETEATYPITATWDFTTADVANAAAALTGSTEAGHIVNNGLSLTIEANGKTIRNNGNSIQTSDGVVFKVPVQGKKDVVTVVGFSSPYYAYSVAGVDATEATTVYTATATDVAQGYVEVINKGQYLISISVTQNEDDSSEESDQPAVDVMATWDFQKVTPSTLSTLSIQSNQTGSVASNVEGIELNVIANAGKLQQRTSDAQFNTGAVIQVPVKNKGDQVVVVSYPDYHYYTIGGTAAEADTETYEANQGDATKGYVEIVATKTAYLYSISVTHYAPKEATSLDNEPATATFPFNLGTEGQTATFSNADYFLNSKVTVGENFTIEGKSNQSGFDQTRLLCSSKETAAGETNLLQFLITPKPGFIFTPTKVSFKATRYGTDGGKMDIAWMNPNKKTVSLATGVTPNRENGKDANKVQTDYKYSKYDYDITGATPAEGACGLNIYIYDLDPGKRYGFADIVIEGTLSGTEKELPVLATITINGTEYSADQIFGDAYEAKFELSKTAQMVSENNPVTATAASGEVGTITYEGTDTQCKVTIPMTAGTTEMNYVLNVVQKPDFTLTYINTDGTEMGTQAVEKDAAIGEFAYDYNTAIAKEGFKVRGWFKKPSGGEKFTTNDVITGNVKLYAVETEIEEPSNFKKYTFDLTDKNFDANDHEAFNPAGSGYYWHDATHGWAFKNGNTVDLLVGPKATIFVTLCQYGSGTGINVKKGEETLATLDGKSDSDGGVAAYNYEGEAGTLTLEMVTGGEMYIHGITINNTTETNYTQDGQWYYVKAGDASSFLEVLDAVNGNNAATDAERSFVYLPNGTYDLGFACLTPVSGHNISIIGESMEGVIIKNLPEAEGIGITATLKNSGTGNYFQDLTIKNSWDYYGKILEGAGAGRAVALWDTGNKTICKNVTLLSYQDTYYTNNEEGNFYWETSDIHGTVDFICGEGTLFMENSTLTVELRNPVSKEGGKGECTITAPSSAAGKNYGYVFNNCKIENYATSYNLGRAWNNEPRCAYINTTVNDNKMIAARWTAQGMNDGCYAKKFVEYNTTGGNTVTSNVIRFYDKSNKVGEEYETVLTAEQAADYAIEKVFGDWAPAAQTEQKEVEEGSAKLENGVITWKAVEGVTSYAIFKKDELLAIVEGTSYTLEQPAASRGSEPTTTADVYTIRAINAMGGMGEPVVIIDSSATAINGINATENNSEKVIYNLQGVRVNTAQKGVYIINGKKVVMK